jgi:hypothetical protein
MEDRKGFRAEVPVFVDTTLRDGGQSPGVFFDRTHQDGCRNNAVAYRGQGNRGRFALFGGKGARGSEGSFVAAGSCRAFSVAQTCRGGF